MPALLFAILFAIIYVKTREFLYPIQELNLSEAKNID